ncbi:hypothetical protein DY000_02048169 [Brassica cretica]|uniref:Peptidase A2 domain-containing protein n=1 Tax=Brassica cretica TaxID=69181 RepID=A0ABQ7F8I2_BRACR|nr:hypothetical protein DY000_02048169 [Brassica cretica]
MVHGELAALAGRADLCHGRARRASWLVSRLSSPASRPATRSCSPGELARVAAELAGRSVSTILVKHEKLQEGDFEVESSMSFSGSHWCRLTPDFEHRSTDFNQNRSTASPEHRSMMPAESTTSCNAVRILTHEEFAAKHPHPPSPIYVSIDRQTDPAIDRHRETAIDRQPPIPIDRRAPLTYRVQLPMIDVASLNALRPLQITLQIPPVHIQKMQQRFHWRNHSRRPTLPKDCGCSSERPRRLKKRRITLKKRSDPRKFAIPCTVKGIEFPHALCDTGASISILPRVMAGHLGLKLEPSKESFTFVDCSQRGSGGIVRDLEVQIGKTLVPVDFHVLDIKLNWNSSMLLGRAFLSTVGAVCNMQTNQLCLTLIDPHVYYDAILVMKPHTSSGRIDDPEVIAACHCGEEYETVYSASKEIHTATSIDNAPQKSIDIDKEESIDSSPGDWENDYYNSTMAVHTAIPTRDTLHREEYGEDYEEERATEYRGAENLFMQQHNIPEHQQRVTNEFYDTTGGVDDRFRPKHRQHTRPSIDIGDPTSIDRHPGFGKRAYDRDGTRRFHWEENDEYGVYRDDHGHARDRDGHIIHVSKDDIRSLLERASMDEHNYLCLPEHARSFTQTKLVPEIYTKDEINEMLFGVYRAQEKNEGNFQMKLDGVYNPLNDIISWLTTCMEEMRQDIAMIQT